MRVGVIGLGKLGLPIAASLAARGHQVIGADQSEAAVDAIKSERPLVTEPGLTTILAEAGERLSVTTDVAQAAAESEICFVIVPTPSLPNGAFSLDYLVQAAENIGTALADREDYPVVVILSTVMPGDTGGKIRKTLEEASGKRCGQDFGLCYSPEFVALGSVIQDLSNPDLILIGESDTRAGDLLEEALRSQCSNSPPVVRTSFVNAELAKLAINTFVTTKISFANMLGELCETLDGGDVEAVTRAVGLDRRIGARYLKAGSSYGGPCFPRDNRALSRLARRQRIKAPLPWATDQINLRQVERLRKQVLDNLPPGGTVGILGLAYKPGTTVVEESLGLKLAEFLSQDGIQILVHDPLVNHDSLGLAQCDLHFAASPLDCVRQVDVAVLCTPCPEFKVLNEQLLESGPHEFRECVIIDCWRMLDATRLGENVRYMPLGRYMGRRKSARKLAVKSR